MGRFQLTDSEKELQRANLAQVVLGFGWLFLLIGIPFFLVIC